MDYWVKEALLWDLGVLWYPAIVGFLILTGCGLPIPEEVAFVVAGIIAESGTLNPMLAFCACMVGALVGDIVMYSIGRRYGRRLLNGSGWFAKVLNEETEKRAEQMINQHGLKAFFIARFLVGVRGPLYIAAGILRVPLWRFLLTDAVCASVVVSIFFGLGWSSSNALARIHESQVVLTIVVLFLAAIVGLYVWWLWRKRRRAKASKDAKEQTLRTAATARLDQEPVAQGETVTR